PAVTTLSPKISPCTNFLVSWPSMTKVSPILPLMRIFSAIAASKSSGAWLGAAELLGSGEAEAPSDAAAVVVACDAAAVSDSAADVAEVLVAVALVVGLAEASELAAWVMVVVSCGLSEAASSSVGAPQATRTNAAEVAASAHVRFVMKSFLLLTQMSAMDNFAGV